jgi:hypothetical protein
MWFSAATARHLLVLARLTGIGSGREQRARLARLRETELGVGAQREQLLFPVESVLQPPPLRRAARRRRAHLKEEAALVIELQRLLAGLDLLDLGVVEGHRGNFPEVANCYP